MCLIVHLHACLCVSQETKTTKEKASKAAGPMDPAVRELCLSLKYVQGKINAEVAAALNEANHRNSKGDDYTMTGVGSPTSSVTLISHRLPCSLLCTGAQIFSYLPAGGGRDGVR